MALTISEIPLQPQPQRFTISLANVFYGFYVQWREKAQQWIMDISDRDGNLLIAGVPLLPGADLLAQYQYLGIDGELWVASDGVPDISPTYSNLGVGSHLYFLVRG
jgi:hypothetical protein